MSAQAEPTSFAFTPEYRARADKIIARYPKGRQQSALLPLLDLAQRQAGWIPRAAIEHIAEILEVAPMRVEEVVSEATKHATGSVKDDTEQENEEQEAAETPAPARTPLAVHSSLFAQPSPANSERSAESAVRSAFFGSGRSGVDAEVPAGPDPPAYQSYG